MKRWVSTVLVVSMLVVIFGCQLPQDDIRKEPKTTEFDVYGRATRVMTVEHDGHKFIVVTSNNGGGTAVILHPDDGKAEKETSNQGSLP